MELEYEKIVKNFIIENFRYVTGSDPDEEDVKKLFGLIVGDFYNSMISVNVIGNTLIMECNYGIGKVKFTDIFFSGRIIIINMKIEYKDDELDCNEKIKFFSYFYDVQEKFFGDIVKWF